jgi:tetratricopeptide (TPR) repeat protein
VIVEKGLQQHDKDWLGHYVLVTGYDDERARFITQDSLIMADLPVPYEAFAPQWWRDFNNVYMVIFPPQDQARVLALLGDQADPQANIQAAAEKARAEIPTLSGRDQYFAWFNLGSNLAALQDYAGAAEAYDQAFAIYPSIPEADRPWRMLWYQTGPYAAYYYTGRHQDVVNLANTTLSFLDKPILEETLYWRGLAREAQGDLEGAIADYQKAAQINPSSTPAMEQLQRLGAASQQP